MKLFGKNKKGDKEDKKETTKEAVEEKVEGAQLPAAPSLPKGGDARSYKVVLSPHITEKGTVISGQNKYIFRVAGGANKLEIKRSVENLYKVEVEGVNILHMPSKFRQVGRFKGRKPGFKKAIVTLKEGSKIDLAS